MNLDVRNGNIFYAGGNLSENPCFDMQRTDDLRRFEMWDKYESGEITQEEFKDYSLIDSQIDEFEMYCMIRGEIYAPFVWLSNGLFFIFLIMGILEPKKKQ
ncbi:MAG: hypothetical protein ABIB71_01240 [Candidatus Woesearchaeota archaeon]